MHILRCGTLRKLLTSHSRVASHGQRCAAASLRRCWRREGRSPSPAEAARCRPIPRRPPSASKCSPPERKKKNEQDQSAE